MVSGWSAKCAQRGQPDELRRRGPGAGLAAGRAARTRPAQTPDYAWTDLTYLLHKHHVSWRYYVFKGGQPDCDDNAMFCKAVPQNAKTPGIWNPLPWFDTVKQDRPGARTSRRSATSCAAARAGTLPAVSWLAPAQAVSEHPPALDHAAARRT